MLRSLAPSDPWRNLTVSPAGQVLHPDQSPFGTWSDATDIIFPSHRDRLSDLNLAALADPMPADAARLFAAAAGGWKAALAWCEENLPQQGRLDEEAAAALVATARVALVWAAYRRRIFAGADDHFFPSSASQWITRAEAVASGEDFDEARAARELSYALIDDATYASYRRGDDASGL